MRARGAGEPSQAPASGLLRWGLLALAGAGVIGAAVDLGLARHWQSPIQLVPWASLGGLAVALALVVAAPTGRTLRIARVLIVVVVASAALGVYYHVAANYATPPLDFRYSDRWEQMSGLARLWAALATLRHPAFAGRSRQSKDLQGQVG